LTEHWPENTKDLSPAVKLVAITITSHLNDKTQTFQLSSKSLMKWSGIKSRSTIDEAVRELVDLGVLQVERERARRPRGFRLLVECPPDCKQLKGHNTKLELSDLSKRETQEAQDVQTSVIERPQIGQGMPVDWATNRKTIENKIDEKDDRTESFEFLFIKETLQQLKDSNQFTSKHELLSKALLENQDQVEEKARAIQARAKGNPQSYLLKVITDTPNSFIPKQDPQSQEAKASKLWSGLKLGDTSTGELESHWNKLKDNHGLVEWESLDLGHKRFLASYYKEHTPLKDTVAVLISNAARENLKLGDLTSPIPKNLMELGELLEENRKLAKANT
jgi:hypothetical protein